MTFPLRITHPKHGAMHVYNKADLDKHVKRGWEAPEGVVVEKPKRKYERKAKA